MEIIGRILTWILPIVDLKEPVYVSMGSRIFTRDRATGQSQEYGLRGWVGRKYPFSPILSSWHVIGWISTIHHRDPTTELLPVLRVGKGKMSERRGGA